MRRFFLGSLSAALGLGLLVSTPQTAAAQRKAPPGGAYKKVSTLVRCPISCQGWGPCMSIPVLCQRGHSWHTTARANW